MDLRLVAMLLLFACDPIAPTSRTIEGRLEEGDRRHDADGSYFDEVRVEAEGGWRITVEMDSTELDPFLQLRLAGSPDERFLRQNDDVDERSRNARLSLRAPVRGTYVVWANAYQNGQEGAYTLRITAGPEQ